MNPSIYRVRVKIRQIVANKFEQKYPSKKKIYLSLLHILHLSNAFQRIIYPILRFLFLLQALARHEYSSKMPQIRHFLVYTVMKHIISYIYRTQHQQIQENTNRNQ